MLPASERAELLSVCQPVALPLNTLLLKAEHLPQYVYLLTSGVASFVSPVGMGGGVEVSMIGREGLTGAYHLLGDQRSVCDCFMQVPGTGLRIDFRKFQQMFDTLPQLHRRVLQHVQHETMGLQQLTACNRVHLAEERLARWLLMAADRAGSLQLPLTQDFMAQMLGTRRTTVTLIAGILQRGGLIQYRRGNVTILDREQMEHTACKCYKTLFRLYQQLYQSPAAPVSTAG